MESLRRHCLLYKLNRDGLCLRSHLLLACKEAIVDQLSVVHARLVHLHLGAQDSGLVIPLPFSVSICHLVEPGHQLHPLCNGVDVLVQTREGHIDRIKIARGHFLRTVVKIYARLTLVDLLVIAFCANMNIDQLVKLVVEIRVCKTLYRANNIRQLRKPDLPIGEIPVGDRLFYFLGRVSS